MRITVTLHATLRKFLPAGSANNSAVIEVPEGATVADLIDRLGIPPGRTKMIVSGDDHLEPTTVLRDGQPVNLFPPLAGGSERRGPAR